MLLFTIWLVLVFGCSFPVCGWFACCGCVALNLLCGLCLLFVMGFGLPVVLGCFAIFRFYAFWFWCFGGVLSLASFANAVLLMLVVDYLVFSLVCPA